MRSGHGQNCGASGGSVLSSAKIAFGGEILDAAVLELSRGGARLYLRRAAAIPAQVQLHLPDGTIVVARQRWRQDEHIGFAFAPCAADRDPTSPPARLAGPAA